MISSSPLASEWYQQRLYTADDAGTVQNFHQRVYGPGFTYADFGALFKV